MRKRMMLTAALAVMLLTALPAQAEPLPESFESIPVQAESLPEPAEGMEDTDCAAVDEAVPEIEEADLTSLIPAEEVEWELSEVTLPSGEEEAPIPLADGTLWTQPPEEYFIVGADADDADLFALYASRLFYGRRPVLMASVNAGEGLTGRERTVYESLKADILRVAAGEQTSTVFAVPVTQLMEKTWYTASELGVALNYDAQGRLDAQCVQALWGALYSRLDVDVGRVAEALWYDCTYELYWFSRYEKSVGSSRPGAAIRYDAALGEYVAYVDEASAWQFRFGVLEQYMGGDDYTVNPALIEGAKRAAQNARAIVAKYADDSDYAKLYGYMVEICRLVRYNTPASLPGWSMSEQNPWKLIWVFDGDAETNVVCEGYTQAFQYLCELSDFDAPLHCWSVDGSANGAHAWNLVRMGDGQNYVVDVTWTDGGWADEYDGNLAAAISAQKGASLFLVGADSGSAQEGYFVKYRDGSGRSWRTYSQASLAAYAPSVLSLAQGVYAPSGFMKISGGTYYMEAGGRFATGERAIDGMIYQFAPDGRLTSAVGEGWQTIDGKRYFFDAGGLHTRHTAEPLEAVAPTCAAPGKTAGSRCAVCGTVLVGQQDIAPLGHSWGEAEYAWSQDGGSVTARRVCLNDPAHAQTETVNTAREVVEGPGCETWGTTLYRAAFSNEAFAPQTRAVQDIAPVGHSWGEAQYTWSEDGGSVTARRVCLNDPAHAQAETVNAVREVVEGPGCETWGTTLYRAAFSNEAFAPQTRAVQDIPPAGHSWGEAQYTWSQDGGSVTAVRACLNDPAHVQTETAPAQTWVSLWPGCETGGEITGTAMFANPGFAPQSRVAGTLPPAGHAVAVDVAVAPSCAAAGLTEGSHCAVCGRVLVPQQPLPPLAHTPAVLPGTAPTYFSAGLTEGSYCAVCGAVLTPQAAIPALPMREAVLARAKSNGSVTVPLGEPLRLVPQFAAANGWTVTGCASGKPKVAVVDAGGIVTPVSEGKAKITVTTANKKKATITIRVVDPYKPTGVGIIQGKAITLTVGQPVQLYAALAPATARATLSWKSSKPAVASVDAGGWVVPLGEGKAKITVTTHNRKKATIAVTVVDPNKPLGIGISQGKAITLKVGEGLQLWPVMNPATAQSALTWKSGKAAVAAVDANGYVAALKKGKAKITVTTYNKKKATITVNVVE